MLMVIGVEVFFCRFILVKVFVICRFGVFVGIV